MPVYKRGNTWWIDFRYAGKRINESARTTRKTIALEYEKQRHLEMERANAGLPTEGREDRIRSIGELMKLYTSGYGVNHRKSSIAFVASCAKNIDRLLRACLLPDLDEAKIRGYMVARQKEGAAGRTINAELAELSRAIGHTWRELWPRVKKLEERRDVGCALSPEEERRLLEAADSNRSQNVRTMVRVSLLTGFRAGELSTITWGQVDFQARVLTVGKAKTQAGSGRRVPMNENLYQVLRGHAGWFTQRFGDARPGQYIFPWGAPYPSDPDRPSVELKTAWNTIRKKAKVSCRWHDLRHTVCTKMAEAGVPESTMLAIMGHMSRAMLERYSHIRMNAKRAAVEALTLPEAVRLPQESPSGSVATELPTAVN